MRAPEQARGSDHQGLWRQLCRAGGRDHQARARAAAGARRPGAGRPGPADRERAQDAAGLLARPARGHAAPGLAAADAALSRGHQAAHVAQPGARVAAGVCPVGQPPGHLAGEVGAGGFVLPLSGARHLQGGGAPAR